jgi:hypothetical protein
VTGARSLTVPQVLVEVGDLVHDEHAAEYWLLEGYLPALVGAAASHRRLTAEERDTCRRVGAEAAAAAVGLPALVDLYMTASRRLWPRLPDLVAERRGRPVRPAELTGIGEAVWRAADDALAALAEGYVEAQRTVVRREEAFRQEFVNDLLGGRGDIASLVERAEPFGLPLAAAHVVAVARAERPVDPSGGTTGWVETAARARLGDRGVLATVKDGCLVCVVSVLPNTPRQDQQGGGGGGGGGVSSEPGETGRLLASVAGPAVAELAGSSGWQVGIGRSHGGPRGVSRSYGEAIEALRIADRLGLVAPVVTARDLLVYRVLMRDETAMADLVRNVLGSLEGARGGAEPLLATVEAYFAAGDNAAAAARRLHLSVRAVTYRLQRVQKLTGYRAGDPAHRLTLQVAVVGARFLDWPRAPLAAE